MGHVLLDLARPRAALNAYREALAIRQKVDGPDTPAVADVYDSIACCHVEMGDVTQANQYIARAIAIHEACDSSKRSRTEAVRALALLRAKLPQEALVALQTCWELQGLGQDQIENSKYPKHSGDIVLLARIHWAQGEKEKARQLMTKATAMRRAMSGRDASPGVVDAMFHLALMLRNEDQDATVNLLQQIIQIIEIAQVICGDAQDMRGHLARALWFLAGTGKDSSSSNSERIQLRERAREELGRLVGREDVDADTDTDTDELFMKLVRWFLW